MKKILIITLFVVVLASVTVLFLDAQSKQGILNDITQKKTVKNEQETLEPTEPEQPENIAQEEVQVPEKKTFTIAIDPGHQEKANLDEEPVGPGASKIKPKVTGGTIGVTTKIPEYVLTLEASLSLQTHLKEKGFDVILTRTSHDIDLSNAERAKIANDHEADLFLRIHADGAESAETSGFSILVPGQENRYTMDIYEDSLRAATLIVAEVEKNIPLLHDGIFFRDDISGFNWSNVPVVLVELGFMTNPEEDRKLADKAYVTDLTRMIADGIEAFVVGE